MIETYQGAHIDNSILIWKGFEIEQTIDESTFPIYITESMPARNNDTPEASNGSAKCFSIPTAVHRALDARSPYDVINSLCISCRGYRRIFRQGSCNRASMATRMAISLIDPETHRICEITLSTEDARKDGR